MRRFLLPAMLLVPALAWAAPTAGADGDESFGPLLHAYLVTNLATHCVQKHPALSTEIDRVRKAWLARNETASSQWDGFYGELSTQRQDAIYERIMAVGSAMRDDIDRADAAGTGAAYCKRVFAVYEAMAPLVPPKASPATRQ